MLFTSLPEVGGHTTISLGLVDLLRSEYEDIWVVSREMPGHGTSNSAVEYLENAGASMLLLQGRTAPIDLIRIVSGPIFKHLKPDAFITIGMRNLSPILSALLRPRVSVYYHITHELTPPVNSMLRRYMRFMDRLVFISPATQSLYENINAKLSHKTLSITQPIVQREFSEISQASEKFGPLRLGFLGRLSDAKGCGILDKFIMQCPCDCSLRIAGSGDYASHFEAHQSKRVGRVQVRFDGAFSPLTRDTYLSEFFSSIDLLVVPSQDDREGIPTVILESLNAGVPVIATRTGGMLAFADPAFGDSACVQLIEKEEILAELMRRARSHLRSEESLRDKCSAYFLRKFSNDVLLDEWLKALAKK